MTKDEFYKKVFELGIELNSNQKEIFEKYANYLIEYNKKTNLTAITNIEDIYLKHFYDSIISCKFYKFSNQNILDIGTGPGFPGIPLLICFPNLSLTVIDSNNKKTTFLKNLKEVLNIEYEIVHGRVEQQKEFKEKFDVVVTRAVADLRVILEISIFCLKNNGNLLVYKSNVKDELKQSKNALQKLNSKVMSVNETHLLSDDILRTIVIIQKEFDTDPKYPRTYDKIKRHPL